MLYVCIYKVTLMLCQVLQEGILVKKSHRLHIKTFTTTTTTNINGNLDQM